jgi:hypothetical protein
MANFIGGSMPSSDILQPSPLDKVWTMTLPTKAESPIPLFHTTDTGTFIKAIVRNRDALLGERLYAASEYLTVQEILDTFKKVYPEAGANARIFPIQEEMFRGFMKAQGMPDHAVTEIWENSLLFDDVGYYAGASLDGTLKLVTEPLITWEEYIKNIALPLKNLK